MSETEDAVRNAVRPPAHYLMLLVRAAVADDGRGGPWLSVMKTHTEAGTPIYTHHIDVLQVDWYSTRRLVLVSGAEALAWAMTSGWSSITDPSVREVRELSEHAIDLHGADLWSTDYVDWLARYCGPEARLIRDEHGELALSAARGLRWTLAEQWLRRPTEA
jgi:hypothetical protein